MPNASCAKPQRVASTPAVLRIREAQSTQHDKMTLYFELRLAARFEGGTTPFSGRSFSIGSERLCSGLSPAEENCGPASATVKPCAVYMASSNVEPLFAAATANTPCGTPLVKAVAM